MKGRKKTEMRAGMHRGFTRGVKAAKLGDQPQLRAMLQSVIGGTTKMYNYQTGRTIIQPGIGHKIERIFARFGIGAGQVWDDTEQSWNQTQESSTSPRVSS